jgi:Histidine kinase-like ATPase domain
MIERALNSTPSVDDIEVLSTRPNWLELRLRCKMETAGRILQFLHEMAMGLPAVEQENIATAFREILLNAVEHGGGSDPDQRVTITYVRTARAVLYYVRDPGKGFSFRHERHPDHRRDKRVKATYGSTPFPAGARAGRIAIEPLHPHFPPTYQKMSPHFPIPRAVLMSGSPTRPFSQAAIAF